MTEPEDVVPEIESEIVETTETTGDPLPAATGGRIYRWIIWAVGTAFFLGYVAMARVHTRLGVEAPSWDKDGRDYVWRSWWRARHGVIDVGPSGFVVVMYTGLAVAFVALSILACWIALVAEEPAATATEAGGSGPQ